MLRIKILFVRCSTSTFHLRHYYGKGGRGIFGKSTTDQDLVHLVLSGDDEAFRILVERYKAYVFAIVYPILRNSADVEDTAQEVFLKIYRSLPKFAHGSFKSWVGRIAANSAIDLKRKQAREMESMLKVEPGVVSAQSAEEEVLSSGSAAFERLLSKLPDKHRRVLFKYYVQQKSLSEIAAAEGVSIRTVESRLYRSRKTLREMWKEGRL